MLEHVVVKEVEEGGCSAAMLEHVVVKEQEEGGCSTAMLEHVLVKAEEEEEVIQRPCWSML